MWRFTRRRHTKKRRPAAALGSGQKPENFYGLLTYSLNQVLLEQRSAITYRDLARAITGRYRAERGGRAPTPLFVGDSDKDLDHVVLGSEHWQPAAINLRRQGEKLQLDAGELLGITPGSILAVLRRPGPAEKDNLLGHVSVTSATPAAATVESIAFGGQPAMDMKRLPESSPCRLVRQAVGDLRTKLLIRSSTDEAAAAMEKALRSVWDQLPEEVRALVEITGDAAAADFELVALNRAEPLKSLRSRATPPSFCYLQPVRSTDHRARCMLAIHWTRKLCLVTWNVMSRSCSHGGTCRASRVSLVLGWGRRRWTSNWKWQRWKERRTNRAANGWI